MTNIVQANEFQLIDSNGSLRGIMGVTESGIAFFQLLDQASDRVALEVDLNGHALIRVSYPNSNTAAYLAADEHTGAGFGLSCQSGELTYEIHPENLTSESLQLTIKNRSANTLRTKTIKLNGLLQD